MVGVHLLGGIDLGLLRLDRRKYSVCNGALLPYVACTLDNAANGRISLVVEVLLQFVFGIFGHHDCWLFMYPTYKLYFFLARLAAGLDARPAGLFCAGFRFGTGLATAPSPFFRPLALAGASPSSAAAA